MKPRCFNNYVCRGVFDEDTVSVGTLKAVKKILLSCKTKFYAEELGLSGSMMRGLESKGIIRKTSNCREGFTPLGYDDLYRKIKIYEWELTVSRDCLMSEYDSFIKSLDI